MTLCTLLRFACVPLIALAGARAQELCPPLKVTPPAAEPYGHFGQACMTSDVLAATTQSISIEFGSLYVFERATGALQFALQPNDGVPGDFFGCALALHGRHAVVGANRKNGHVGAAHVFDVQQGKQLYTLNPPGPAQAGLVFGSSVAIDAQYVAVGAPGAFPSPPDAGSVYVFERRTGALRWKLAPPELTSGFFDKAYFGSAVAADRGRLLAGAPHDAIVGSAYLFDTASGSVLHKLFAPPGAAPQSFGNAVDLRGNVAAIADRQAGAVHVYHAGSGLHLFTAELPAGESGGFGVSIALDEQYLAVGSTGGSDPPFSGAVYVFRLDTAELVAKLHGFPAETTFAFGYSVDLYDGALAASDPQDNELALYAGAAYMQPLAPCR